MQLSSRGPSGPGHRARLLSWKDHPRRGRYGLPTRRAGAIRRPTPNTTPLPRHRPRSGATPRPRRAPRARPRRARARHPRQGDRSGRTSAVVSASARHAFGVGATTRSPCSSNSRSRSPPGGPTWETVLLVEPRATVEWADGGLLPRGVVGARSCTATADSPPSRPHDAPRRFHRTCRTSIQHRPCPRSPAVTHPTPDRPTPRPSRSQPRTVIDQAPRPGSPR